MNLPGNENGGPDCCHCLIRRPRPFAGCVRSRVPPGGMSARPRVGSRRSMKEGACMKPAHLYVALGSLPPLRPALILWDWYAMGKHTAQWKPWEHVGFCGNDWNPAARANPADPGRETKLFLV